MYFIAFLSVKFKFNISHLPEALNFDTDTKIYINIFVKCSLSFKIEDIFYLDSLIWYERHIFLHFTFPLLFYFTIFRIRCIDHFRSISLCNRHSSTNNTESSIFKQTRQHQIIHYLKAYSVNYCNLFSFKLTHTVRVKS